MRHAGIVDPGREDIGREGFVFFKIGFYDFKREAHGGVVDHRDVNPVLGCPLQMDVPDTRMRMGDLHESVTGTVEIMACNVEERFVGAKNRHLHALSAALSAQVVAVLGAQMLTLDHDVDLLHAEARHEKAVFRLALFGEGDALRPGIAGVVDDRVKAPEGRRQILRAAHLFKRAVRPVGIELKLDPAVLGNAVHVQEDAVDGDALRLRGLQRLIRNRPGPQLSAGNVIRREIRHAVGKQEDHAGQAVFLAHARQKLRRP